METTIKKDPNVIASASEGGVLIYTTGSWSVAIDKYDAAKYADQGIHIGTIGDGFNRILDGDVTLSHKGSKMALNNNEANAILELIHVAKKEIWN